jgi:hypothetical protein
MGELKIIAGSILSSMGLVAEVVNEWASHYFYTFFTIAKSEALKAGGPFTPPGIYIDSMADGFGVNIFVLTRILIWLFIVVGIVLVVWGLREKKG